MDSFHPTCVGGGGGVGGGCRWNVEVVYNSLFIQTSAE